jgi:2-keto-4-pentenoate hydratase/2-oxohepta-3-ene-1,7-dioic acid hydratase in catechol pathway
VRTLSGNMAPVRIARYTTGGDPAFAVVEGEPGHEVLIAVHGDPLYQDVIFTGERIELDDARLLAPVIPRSKIVAIGRNYAEHAAELGNDVPEEPLMFLKPNTAIVGPGDPVVLPPQSERVDYEGELAVVIGRLCKDVPEDKVSDVVYGYTCANDVTARDLQHKDGQWARAKGFDTFCPVGPWIRTDLDVTDIGLTTRLDGETVQQSRTSLLVHPVAKLVSYVSAMMTLLPGDLLLTGTPAGIGPVNEGQRVEVEIEGIGVLSNPFVTRG